MTITIDDLDEGEYQGIRKLKEAGYRIVLPVEKSFVTKTNGRETIEIESEL